MYVTLCPVWSMCCHMPMFCSYSRIYVLYILLLSGTEIASSTSTFRPHLGRVIKDLFYLLHDVLHSAVALVCSNFKEGLALIFERIANAYPGSSAQTRCQCSSHIGAGTASAVSLSVQARMLAVVALSNWQ